GARLSSLGGPRSLGLARWASLAGPRSLGLARWARPPRRAEPRIVSAACPRDDGRRERHRRTVTGAPSQAQRHRLRQIRHGGETCWVPGYFARFSGLAGRLVWEPVGFSAVRARRIGTQDLELGGEERQLLQGARHGRIVRMPLDIGVEHGGDETAVEL